MIRQLVACRIGAVVTAGLALVWVIAAGARPDATFHLAPLLVTGGGAILAGPDCTANSRVGLIAFGAAISVVTTAVLASVGAMEGPSLLPVGGAALESVLFTGGAAVAAGVYALRVVPAQG